MAKKRAIQNYGHRLRRVREDQGLYQGQLAERVGVARTTIIHIEQGHANYSISSLLRISRVLDVCPRYLLNIDKVRKPYQDRWAQL